MDTVEKRANGIPLNARDETRLRNHQLRMMRRAWLSDMIASPREPLWPSNDLWWGKGKYFQFSVRFQNYWKLLSDKLFLPKGVRPWYIMAFADELLYGRIQNTPKLALWGMVRGCRYIFTLFPIWFLWMAFREELALDKYPTIMGQFPAMNRSAQLCGRNPIFPTDKTFTTRLRNVELGHSFVNVEDNCPRMRPGAETFPPGTRMNWVTFQPIYPEDNILQSADYGNGPGGHGNMTETYRLVHATKPHGLYSKIDPNEPFVTAPRYFRWFYRTIFNREQADTYDEKKHRDWTLWHSYS